MQCDCSIIGEPGHLSYSLCRGHQDIIDKSVAAERARCVKVIETIGAASPLVRECSGGAALAAVVEAVVADVCKRLADLIRKPEVGK